MALTHHVHVDTVGVGPCVLEVFFEALTEGVGDDVEANELLYLLHLRVVACGAGVETLNDRRNVAKNTRIHEGCNTEAAKFSSSAADSTRISHLLQMQREFHVCCRFKENFLSAAD